jgi:hypothetical protein
VRSSEEEKKANKLHTDKSYSPSEILETQGGDSSDLGATNHTFSGTKFDPYLADNIVL